MTAAIILGALIVLILIGQNIAFAIGTVAVGAIYIMGLPASLIGQTLYSALDNEAWAAIPLYLLMGHLLVQSGIASDLYRAINVWTKGFPGGLAIATIATSAIFAAVSGTSIGTVAAMARVSVPEMISRGYHPRFAYGTLASASTLGILIPPSIPLILFGMVTEESIVRLFLAGIIPGIMLALFFSAYCVFYAWFFQKDTLSAPAPWREKLRESARSVWGLLLISLVLGGLYSGLLTVTESAGFGAFLALILSVTVYRSFSFSVFLAALKNTVIASCMILVIVIFASLFSSVISILHIPQDMTIAAMSLDLAPWMIILVFSVLLFFMGQLLDVPSVMLISLPIMYPIIVEAGYNPIWFAILIVLNMEVATITPPVGLNIYVLKGAVPSAQISDIVIGSIPFIALIMLMMLILYFFPQIALWLPGQM